MTRIFACIAVLILSSCTSHVYHPHLGWTIEHGEAPSEDVVAAVFDQPVNEEQLLPKGDPEWADLQDREKKVLKSGKSEESLAYHDILARQYEYKITRVKHIAERVLLMDEAAKAGIDLSTYIEKKVVGHISDSTESEVWAYAASKGVVEQEFDDTLKERFKYALQDERRNVIIRDYVASATAKRPIKVYFEVPHHKIELKDEWMPIKGQKDATTRAVLFSDLNCSPCKDLHEVLMQLQKEYPSKLSVGYRILIPDHNPISVQSAQAALCFFEQNEKYFWEFLEDLYAKPFTGDQNEIPNSARKIGANQDTLMSCLTGQRFKEILDFHFNYAKFLEVNALPTLFIDGELYVGPPTKEALSQTLLEEIHEVRSQPPWWKRIWNWFASWF